MTEFRLKNVYLTIFLSFIWGLYDNNLCSSEIQRKFRIAENVPSGTLVGHVKDITSDTSSSLSLINSYASYLFVYPPESQIEQTFAINEQNGEIKTKKQLDYETKSFYVFLAIPTDGGQGIRVIIEVIDVDDNAPKFPHTTFNLQLSEYAKINSEIPLPSATDLDSGQFGVQKYELSSGNVNNAFRLSTRRLNGILYLDLIVNAELDREFKDNYLLEIKAFDGGQPPLTSVMFVNVTILDANDNAPQFDEQRYVAQIKSNASVGTSVIRIRATDKDIGANSAIEYKLTVSPNDAQKYFIIDQTGLITVGATLGPVKQYELLVIARDKGLQALETTTFVSINLSDINNEPDMKIVYLSDDGSPTISEDAEIGSFVARLSINDQDTKNDDYRRLNVSIFGGDECFGVQSSDDIVYILLAKNLDRERRNNYSLTLVVTDKNRAKVLRRNIEIRVSDVNDNAPQFLQNIYESEINEKSTTGTSVLQVTAVDRDEGLNSEIIYSLSPNSAMYSSWFEIDADTGLITSADVIDCEISSKPEFTVVAKDKGEQSMSSTAKVTISIIDVNDNAPIFDKNIYNVSVKEDADIGTCFLKVTAADPDCGVNAQVRYNIPLETQERNVFSMNEKTGSLCLGKSLDFETRSTYQFLISAYDGGGLSSSSLVVVYVEDVNDNAPIFYPSVYNVNLRQSSQPGAPVVIVSAVDLDNGNFGSVTYRIASGDDHHSFRMESKKGELYVESPLSPTVYQLTIQATDGGNLVSVQPALITITILQNDSPSPVFEEKFYRVTVREDTLPGIAVAQVKAAGQGPLTYDIYSGDPNGYFTIDKSTGKITVAKYLDHETQESLLLNVQAALGSPPVYNHTQVQVLVEDINDNSPYFEQKYVKVTVFENHDLQTPFFVAKATDKDSGKNGEVRYKLINNFDGTFLLHVISGELRLNKPLDYEERRNYSLTIVAQDGGIPPLSANMTLEVDVLDANDHEPVFFESSLKFVVPENTPQMTRIGQIIVTDADSGSNGRITYKLSGGDPNGYFGIFGDTGWIYVRKSLDRETINEFTLTVTAKDNGEPSKSASGTVKIEISDVNDNAPNCSASQEFYVEENIPTTTFVGQLLAHDADLGHNGSVTFFIKDNKDLFLVNDKGELFIEKPLDRESVHRYDLSILARDGGYPALLSTCTIVVHVTDVNDNAPSFILPHQNRIFYREQQTKGAEVVQVRANDPDNGENGTVKYKLESASNAKSTSSLPFSINAETGLITNEKVLDYETDPHVYDLNIVAEDFGRPLKRATRALTVELVDIADGGHTKSGSVSFDVSENKPIGTKLGKVDKSAIDVYDDNSPFDHYVYVEYSIVSGNSFGVFDIDRSTSVLYLLKKLDYETQSSHYLVINRLDLSTSYPNSTTIEVKIIVVDENDNSPEFPEDPVIFSVPENVPLNQIVWVYNATDRDTGAFGRIQYKISEQTPENVFKIDLVTGELKVIKNFDFERFNEYILVVEATDQAPNVTDRRITRVTTRVYVTDINDNNPIFISRDEVHVFEDEPVGYPVIFLAATDSDWLENGRVTYSIKSGNEKRKFAINATSGALTLAQRLDREDSRLFTLTVAAEDHGNPSLSSTQILKINLLDINDNAPRFEQSIYRANVTENLPPGTIVVQLKAIDSDRGVNSELVYILPPGIADNKFRINEKTGVIVTSGHLDREQREQYILTVYVRDSAYPARYDATSVIVTVADLNDNSPLFSNSTCLPLSVPENKRFQSLHSLIASDKDVGLNGQIFYSIAGGNVDGKFHINASTGEISSDSLDRETIAAYNLTIIARDGGSPTLSDSCVLTIYVLDENDNNPVFEQPSYIVEVAENVSVRKVILKFQATDADEGLNGQVSFSLVNETAAMFDVNPENGDLMTIGHLDFEKRQSYDFFVEVSDQGQSEPRRSVAKITVKVLDVNDNAPSFVEIPFTANVTSEIPAGQRVIKVTAIDTDGPGPNSEIYYGFLNTSDSDMYGINPTTGVISAKQNLRFSPGTVQYLNIFATDKGAPSLQTVGIVEIIVHGSLNLSPVLKFDKPKYDFKIAEHASKGVVVGQVKTIGQFGSVEYKISGGNELGAFGIESKTGKVFVIDGSHLDYEKSSRYQLIIEAKVVLQQTTSSVFVGMTIEVQDVNDHAPQFLQQRYRTAVWEGKSRGTYVVQVSATDDDYGENAQITYSIVSGNLDSAFTIDNNGVARTNAELDREIVDHYTLTVMATDYGTPPRSGTTVIDVQVVDVNDNSPSFPPSRLIKISENAEVGTLLTTITANDVDTYPALTYSFTADGNPGDHFALVKFSGRLTLLKQLDYEKQKEFSLQIQVSDELHVVTVKQKVVVLDENDNAPNFVQQFYQVSVPVDTPGGTSVVQVAATDLDSGQNGEISYHLGEVIPSMPGFWIDSNTGAIFINHTITSDMEKNPLIQLAVEARDNGLPQQTSVTSVQFQIVGKTSQEQAKFEKTFFNFSLPEDAPLHSVVGKLSVSSDAKHLLFGIKSGDPSRMFSVDSEGDIILMKQLDREVVGEYKLQITVQTKVNSVANSSTSVLIKVEDVNDNSPEFDRAESGASVSDKATSGSQVMQVTASDNDVGDNAKLRYEITSGDQTNLFEIEPETGIIRVRSSLSFEEPKTVRLIVMVSDSGQPPRSALTSVLISISDDGEKALFFPMPLYLGRIAENEPPNALVFTVKVVNRDGTEYSHGNYSLSGEESQYFSISASNGEVRSLISFDYETKTSYRFTIRATDSYGRRTTVPGQVLIKGVDEYAPDFSQTHYIFQVSYDASLGDMVGVIYATDRDAGLDGQIIFLMKESNYFGINPSTGMIFVTQSLLALEKSVNSSQISTGNGQKDVQSPKLFLTVVAYSGQDSVLGKSNTTNVELKLGYFSKTSSSSNSTTSTAITVSSVVLVIIVVLLLFLVLKLRCRNDKPSSVNRVSYPKQTVAKIKTSNGKTSHTQMYTNGHAHGTTTSRSNAKSPKTAVMLAAKDDKSDKFTVIMPPIRRTQPLASVSNWSAKSSGRGSVTVDDEDEEIRRLTSRSSDRSRNVRSGPDSGIHLFPEDTGSIGSELPSTQEYLTSLGVSTSSSAVPTTKHHDVNQVVNVGKMEALEQYLDAQDSVADGVDVQELIYSKVSEVLADEGDVPGELPDIRHNNSKMMSSSNSAILPEMNDLAIRNQWHTPITSRDCGPTFQPVTQVIAKAAKAERDSLPRRRNNNNHSPMYSDNASLKNSDKNHSSDWPKKQRPQKLNANLHLHSNNSNESSSSMPSPNVWLPQNGFPVTPEPKTSTPTGGMYESFNRIGQNHNLRQSQFNRKDSDDSELEIKI